MAGISDLLMDAGATLNSMAPAAFDAFAKGISLFAKALKPKVIHIHKAKLIATADYGRTIFQIDFSDVFPSQRTMSFVTTKEDIKALQEIQGNSPIIMLEDEALYYVANDTTILTLTKYRGTAHQISFPDLSKATQLGETVTITDTESITNVIKGSKWTGLFSHAGQLDGFITSTSIFRLFKSESCNDAVGTSPDYIFKCYSFLKMVGTYADLNLFSLNGQFWLKTTTNLGKTRKGGRKGKTKTIGPIVTVYERLRPARLRDFPRLLTLLSQPK
jgi:hypothetical protein